MIFAMVSIGVLGFLVWAQMMGLLYYEIWVIIFAICWDIFINLSTIYLLEIKFYKIIYKQNNFYDNIVKILNAFLGIEDNLNFRLSAGNGNESSETICKISYFNNYKEFANKYYDELAQLDKSNAYDYNKLKVKYNYPL